MAQQKVEIERAQAESQQLASQLSQALVDRDASIACATEATQKFSKIQQENALLSQQLDDTARQLKALLRELGRMQDASLPSDADLELIEPAECINDVITNNLVLYRSIPQLQDQEHETDQVHSGARAEDGERGE